MRKMETTSKYSQVHVFITDTLFILKSRHTILWVPQLPVNNMSKLIQNLKIWSGYDKFENFRRIIQHYGGYRKSVRKFYLQDDLKIGTLVGTDQFGNKYYENPYYFVPRNRWVEYNEAVGLNYNASQIPPEWHRWMTHMTEYPPTVEKPVSYPWMLPHLENQTGTPNAYMPYSTVKPKIQAWRPGSIKSHLKLEAGKQC